MADETQRIVIEFEGKDKLSDTLNAMKGGMDKLMGGIKAVAAVFVTGEMAKAVQYFVKAGMDAVDSTKRMEYSFKLLGDTTGAIGKQYENLLEGMSRVSGFTDERLQNSMTKLLNITRDSDAAFTGLKVAMDMSRVTGMGLEESAQLIGRAYEQGSNVLHRYGIYVNGTAKGMDLLTQLQKKFNGANEEFLKQGSGPWEQFKANIDGIANKIGEAILPTVNKLFTAFNKLFTPTAEMERWKNDLAYASGQLNIAEHALFKNADTIKYWKDRVKEAQEEIAKLNEQLNKTPDATKKKVAEVQNMFENSAEYMRNNWAPAVLDISAIVGDAIGQTAAGSTTAWKSAAKSMILSILDFAEKALQASVLVGIGTAAWRPDALPMAIAGTIGLEALKGAISYGMSDTGAGSGGSSPPSGSQYASSSLDGSSVATTSTAPATVNSSGGGGGSVINIYSPTFISDTAIIEFFNKAKTMGYTISKNDYAMASGV